MKLSIIFCILFIVVIGLVKADEVTLSVKQIKVFEFSCTITNATRQQIYVWPIYQEEQFYAQPNCSTCATGWVGGAPIPLGKWSDFIPVTSGASLQFTAVGRPIPWRITCVATTNVVHITDKALPDKKSEIIIRSAEISGVTNAPHISQKNWKPPQ